MILTVAQSPSRELEVDLPAGWRELPPANVLGSNDWIFEWIEESQLPVESRERLAASLCDTARFALTYVARNRSWVAVIDQSAGVVCALASISTIDITEAALESIGSVAEPEVPLLGTIMWLSRQFDEVIAGHPAIVVHDIGAYNFVENGAVIAERYVGTVFPGVGATAVQLEILTETLESFPDVVAMGNAVLDGIRFVDGY